jgi:hypothetical protein
MRRITALLGALVGAVLVLVTGVVVLGPVAPASAATGLGTPYARESVRLGDRDTSVHHIEHVREVQVRLRRVGLYHAAVDGSFGVRTERAVKAFQTRMGLTPTGVVDRATWRPLIRKSTHLAVPSACRRGGWHMCVDRFHHEATLFHDGGLYNSWLVRTGASDMRTRLGTNPVYWRDIDHVSNTYGGSMPYAQFFSGGEALHGSVLMMDPFVGHSHGCVNFWLEDARQLWNLTSNKHLVVTIHGAWD